MPDTDPPIHVLGPRAEAASAPAGQEVFSPSFDIHETAEGLVLEADLPGVPADALTVAVKANILQITGRVRWPVPPQATLLYQEFRPGDFQRSFILSEEVDAEKITADFNHGVLRLVLPRASRPAPRKVAVRTSH
jgi:HSP20 family molecular chaperone IbpA